MISVYSAYRGGVFCIELFYSTFHMVVTLFFSWIDRSEPFVHIEVFHGDDTASMQWRPSSGLWLLAWLATALWIGWRFSDGCAKAQNAAGIDRRSIERWLDAGALPATCRWREERLCILHTSAEISMDFIYLWEFEKSPWRHLWAVRMLPERGGNNGRWIGARSMSHLQRL